MANNNDNNPATFIFIFIAFMMFTGGAGGFVVPLILFYILTIKPDFYNVAPKSIHQPH